MLKPYTIMAECYDHLLKHVDYDEWYSYLKEIMIRYTKTQNKILEIGTGTGKFGAKFSSDNFQIFGMDLSLDMLKVASSRAYDKFQIFCADVRSFKLKSTFDFIFSVHDTLNYLLNRNELLQAFKNIKSVMNQNSIFMFDITTEYNITRYFDNQSESFKIKDLKINWTNKYDKENRLIYSDLIFTNKKNETETETHVQKIHSVEEISDILKEVGLEIIDIFSDYTFEPYDSKTVMINFITRVAKQV